MTMNEQDNQVDDDGLHDRIFATIRRATSMEQHQFHLSVTLPLLESLIGPIIENQRQIMETQAEHSRSLGLLIDGQILLEKSMASLMPDDDGEAWKHGGEA
jgi:hypothetical protein